MSIVRYLTIFFVFLLISSVCPGYAQEILVLRSMKIKPYIEAFNGFRSALNSRAMDVDFTIVESRDFLLPLRDRKPDLILAIGADALRKAALVQDVPIVSLMVINPQSLVGSDRSLAGVGMTIAPEKQLSIVHRVLPDARRIGIIFDPKKSSPFVKRAQRYAREMRLELLLREVNEPRAVAEALTSLKGVADLLWMIPDTTAITAETVELMMLYSLENRVPVCTFSMKYLEMGAFMSLDINAFEMGKQAGFMAAKVLAGGRLGDSSVADAESVSVTINDSVARTLRIPVSDELRGNLRVVK